MTLYHGTSAEALPLILRDGLKLGACGLIWATESRDAAELFARAGNRDYAVVAIEAPKSAYFFERPLTRGRKDVVGTRIARFCMPIPATWIKRTV